ncbi:hypothetical protein FI667_g13884, partial [Globisporangium splendens]
MEPLFVDDDQERAFEAALAFVDDYASSDADAPATPTTSASPSPHRNDDAHDDQVDVLSVPLGNADDSGAFAIGSHSPRSRLPRRHVRSAVAPATKQAVVKRNGKILFKVKPNHARDGRREELIYLNNKVAELEAQLKSLQENRGALAARPVATTSALVTPFTSTRRAAAVDGDPDVTGAQVWQEFAERQRDERMRAERENIRLKLVLENQLKIAKSLEGVLIKKTSTKEIEKCLQSHHIHRMHPLTVESTDTQIFEDLVAGIAQSYAEVDQVFVANGLSRKENAHSDAQVRTSDDGNGMYLEFFANKILPFDMHSTGAAVWNHFVSAKERTPSRFYYNKASPTGLAVPPPSTTDDTVMEHFHLELHANSTRGNFRVKQVMRRYVEDERIVIVWRACIDPIEFSDEPFAGVRFHEKGYIVVKRPSTLSDEYAVLQQCDILTPVCLGDLLSDSDPKVGAITDFVLSSTAANITASRQMIENVLLEQVMNTFPRHA